MRETGRTGTGTRALVGLLIVGAVVLVAVVAMAIGRASSDNEPAAEAAVATSTSKATTTTKATTTITAGDVPGLGRAGVECRQLTLDVPPAPGVTPAELVGLYVMGFSIEGWVLTVDEIYDCQAGIDAAVGELGGAAS